MPQYIETLLSQIVACRRPRQKVACPCSSILRRRRRIPPRRHTPMSGIFPRQTLQPVACLSLAFRSAGPKKYPIVIFASARLPPIAAQSLWTGFAHPTSARNRAGSTNFVKLFPLVPSHFGIVYQPISIGATEFLNRWLIQQIARYL